MGYEYEILWVKDFDGGSGNMGAAIDSRDNAIVCGINLEEDRGVVVKYDGDGNEQWSDSDLPEMCNFGSAAVSEAKPIVPPLIKKLTMGEYGYFFDVAVDSRDNIVVAGTFTRSGGTESIIYVKKYTPDGSVMWEKTYSPFQVNIASGVAIDRNDDIIVAGGGGSITSLSFKGFLLKLSGSNGRRIWRATRRKGMIAFYTCVATGNDGNPVAAGFSGHDDITELMVTKFGGMAGLRRRELTMPGNKAPTGITADSAGNFMVAGKSGEGYQYLLKFDSYFNVTWEKEQDRGFLYGVDTLGNGNVAVTGYKDGVNEYYAALYDRNTGEKLLDMMLGKQVSGRIDDYMRGVSADSMDNMVVTGARTTGRTIKIRVKQLESEPGQPHPPNPPPPHPPHGGKESFIEKILRWIFGR